jgi:hypothetical protein
VTLKKSISIYLFVNKKERAVPPSPSSFLLFLPPYQAEGPGGKNGRGTKGEWENFSV